MSYYLRIEGMNLGSFILDTNDLATIRGGSLLLLEAMEHVEKIINEQLPCVDIKDRKDNNTNRINQVKLAIKSLKGDEKKDKEKELACLKEDKKRLNKALKSDDNISPTISKGASWGLFELDIEQEQVLLIKKRIVDFFNEDEKYRYATFCVDLYKKTPQDSYQSARDKIQTLNRWQQLQTPSLAITKQGQEVCVFDKVTPADNKVNLTDNKQDYVSNSVHVRRCYGQNEKNQAGFYKKRVDIGGIDQLKLTNDLNELSENSECFQNLNGKIAFIYIDGNDFGNKQKASQTPDEQHQFDKQIRGGREKVLSLIMSQMLANPNFLNGDKLRLETLLWGGDEIIWVVPAWQGWWMLNQFYQKANDHIRLEKKQNNGSPDHEALCHGAAIIICKHNAPIYRIDTLARSLADGFAKPDFRDRNMIAYQVLESFDHAGSDLYAQRKNHIQGVSTNISDLLIDAKNMLAIEACIIALKKSDFPKRKIYQIVQSYRNNDANRAQEFYEKLIGLNRSDGLISNQQKIYQEQLEKLKDIFNGNAYWIHLMELWDYIGLEPSDDVQGGDESL